MEIDYEAAWAEMKALLLTKGSHGQRDLLTAMARFEVENRVPAGAASLPVRSANGHTSHARRRAAVRDA